MIKSSVLILILATSIVHCQFIYNYEEDEPEPEAKFDSNRNIPETTANEQYIQPSQPSDSPPRSGRTRTHIRIRSNNYQPQMDKVDSNNQPPDVDARTLRQERRQEKRRQRQRMSNYDIQHEQPSRVYGPSVFERIGLGEPPAGVFVPQDSLLNALRGSGNTYQLPMPQTSSFVQPAMNYANEPRQRFFVQPPSSTDDSSTTSWTSPDSRPQTVVTPSRQARPQLQGRSVDSGRQTRNRTHRRKVEPVVDLDSYREHTDDIVREEIQIVPKVEYVTAYDNTHITPTQRSRIVPVNPPRSPTYSRSVFENVPLGEAPNGIYVPEDSLLNTLRNPSAQRSVAVQGRSYSPPQNYYHTPEESVSDPEIVDEDYPLPPPPPVRPASRRQSNRRSGSSQRQRSSVPQETAPVQPRQRSSQRQRNDDVEEFERKPQQQPRRQQSTAVTLESSQASTRGRPFKEAKLAQAELPLDSDDDGIPGEAGTDYPTLHVIPRTSFSCSKQSYNGYYADLDTSCQVVHLCQAGGVKSSFLCPNGTIFSQEKFSCQWWYEVNCDDAPNYYIKNDELYKIPEKKVRKRN